MSRKLGGGGAMHPKTQQKTQEIRREEETQHRVQRGPGAARNMFAILLHQLPVAFHVSNHISLEAKKGVMAR